MPCRFPARIARRPLTVPRLDAKSLALALARRSTARDLRSQCEVDVEGKAPSMLPGMQRTMAWRFEGRLTVVVHGALNPSNLEWQRMLTDETARGSAR